MIAPNAGLARADRLARYSALHAQGLSQRQVAQELGVPRTTLQAWLAWHERLDACPQGVAFLESVPGLAFLHRLTLALHVVCVAVGACGIGLVCRCLPMTGRHRCVGASYGTPQHVHRRVEEAMVAYRQEERPRLAPEMPAPAITRTPEETFTGGLCLVGLEPVSNAILVEHPAEARAQATWRALMEQALTSLPWRVIQSTSDEAPGLLAYVEHPLGVPHAPDLFQVQQELSKAVAAPLAVKQRAAPRAVAQAEETLKRGQEAHDASNGACGKRGPGRPPTVAACREPVIQDGTTARQESPRLARQRETVTQSIRALGHAYHLVDLERGGRRNGQLMAEDIRRHIDTRSTIAQHEHRSEACLDRIEQAKRGIPKMQATIEFVSGSVRRQVKRLELAPPPSFAMHARLMPSYSLDRVASTRTGSEGESLRALAERRRMPLLEPGGVLGERSPMEQNRLTAEAAQLAEGFQRSSSTGEGRHGDLSLRTHQLRGLDHPRKRACLTAMHNFFLTRPDGTTAAERCFGPKPRSLFAAILGSVAIPPAPLSPPRRALG